MTALPTRSEAEAHLGRILARGSVNLGETAGTERLMLMLTRSCQLRCGYCLVNKSETAPTMPLQTAKRAVDLLMRSHRPRLELQLFGGEPTSAWPVLVDTLAWARRHPALDGRALDVILTTNGLGLSRVRAAVLEDLGATVLFSLDGDAPTTRRYRGVHAEWGHGDDEAWRRLSEALAVLQSSRTRWFMNAVVPPADAGSLPARYEWAISQGIPALQLNYAVGMRWSEAQADRYLTGLVDVLERHHADPDAIALYNWKSDCEPVMLSDDIIVDVDGAVLHDGAIFLERGFPALARTYRLGHLGGLDAFDPLRWSLARLYDVMMATYPEGSAERDVIAENIVLGAAVDLAIQRLTGRLGRPTSPGAV